MTMESMFEHIISGPVMTKQLILDSEWVSAIPYALTIYISPILNVCFWNIFIMPAGNMSETRGCSSLYIPCNNYSKWLFLCHMLFDIRTGP